MKKDIRDLKTVTVKSRLRKALKEIERKEEKGHYDSLDKLHLLVNQLEVELEKREELEVLQ